MYDSWNGPILKQSNPVTDTDTEGAIESVRAYKRGARIQRGSWKPFLVEQNTKEIKDDISILKLNISHHHKAVIPRTEFTETLKYQFSTELVWC